MQRSKAELYRKNFMFLVLEGSFFMAGTGFFNTSTVVPVFIDRVTHSNELVGLTLTLTSFFTYFGRLIIGPFMPHVRNHARFTTILMFICRPQTLLTAFFALIGQYQLAVLALMYSYSVLWLADGLVVPAWSEVLANTVDESRHGRLLGLQMLFGGIASIAAGLFVSYFLGRPNPNLGASFGLVFLVGGILFTLSCFMMSMTENADKPFRTGKVDFKGYYRELPKYLRLEKDNTRVLCIQFVLMVAAVSISFVILFAQNHFGIHGRQSSVLIIVQSIGIPLGGWIWGQICDRFGCVTGLKLAGLNALLIAALPIAAFLFPSAPMLFLVPAMFLAGANSGVFTCYYVYNIQAVRPSSRSACLVLSSVITLPATFSSYAAGFISDRFGYIPMFVCCAAVSLFSILMAFRVRPIETVLAEREKEEGTQSAAV